MKRRREMDQGSEIRSAIEELSMVLVKVQPPGVDSTPSYIPTKPFLYVCNLVIQVLDKIGPTMAVLRQVIDQNIQRLEKLYECDPSLYSNVIEILKKEAKEGNARKGISCSKAFVWLTRTMDFAVSLLQLLVKDLEKNMEQAVEESYTINLKPWHGWISAAAYKVALKLLPDRKTFTDILMSKDEDYDMLKQEIQTFISLLMPLLEQIHSTLKHYGLDRLKST